VREGERERRRGVLCWWVAGVDRTRTDVSRSA
jgi:hypothetical protein